MSWLWGNESTEQAQIVVSALQSELDEREAKIKALEAALRREQQEFQTMLQGEVKELEARKQTIQQELQAIDALIEEKQTQLTSGIAVKKPQKKKIQIKEQMPVAPAASEDTKPQKPAKPCIPVDPHVAKVAAKEPNVAFIIQRSTNANTVVYAGKRSAQNRHVLDPSKPLDVFWFMYEKDGAPREELNMVERNSAYGASCGPVKQNQCTLTLSALKDRELTLVVTEDEEIQCRTVINLQPNAVLRRVFVQMTSSWGIPTVEYIEIFGFDPQSGATVYEKKTNK